MWIQNVWGGFAMWAVTVTVFFCGIEIAKYANGFSSMSTSVMLNKTFTLTAYVNYCGSLSHQIQQPSKTHKWWLNFPNSLHFLYDCGRATKIYFELNYKILFPTRFCPRLICNLYATQGKTSDLIIKIKCVFTELSCLMSLQLIFFQKVSLKGVGWCTF